MRNYLAEQFPARTLAARTSLFTDEIVGPFLRRVGTPDLSRLEYRSGGGVKLTSTLKKDTIEDPERVRIEVLVRFYPPPY